FERPSGQPPAGRGPRRPRGPDLATKMLEAKRRRTKKGGKIGKRTNARATRSDEGSWAPPAKTLRKKPARSSAKATRGDGGKSTGERSRSTGERSTSVKGPKKSKRRR
ncbi:MAG: hypothetical protein ABW217_15560, partial [Polyangiaceae bacterium]